jgi:hypothetical protein
MARFASRKLERSSKRTQVVLQKRIRYLGDFMRFPFSDSLLIRTGRNRSSFHGTVLIASIVSVAATIALSGCATVPKSVYSADPALLLENKAQIYAQLSGGSLREIAYLTKHKDMDNLIAMLLKPTVAAPSQNEATGSGGSSTFPAQGDESNSKFNMDQIMSFLNKATKVGIGLNGIADGKASGEAVVLGDFPVMPIRLALATSGDWIDGKSGYSNRNAALYLRAPQPGILHFSTLAEQSAQIGSPPVDPLPQRFSGQKSSDILIWINQPAELLGKNLVPDGFDIPIKGILCAASRVDQAGTGATLTGDTVSVKNGTQPADPLYNTDIYVVMKDAKSAAAYRPVVRFLWTGLVESVFKENMTSILERPIDLDDDTYVVKGIRLPISVLSGALFKISSLRK